MSQSWWQLDWIWTTTGWLLAALGGALLLWALFSDRARGRRRCPKCWYDMTGAVPKLHNSHEQFTCPECGRITRGIRRLHRTRRRWRPLPLVPLLFLAAVAAYRAPGALRHGWIRMIPSTYLALYAPADLRDPLTWRSSWRRPAKPAAPTLQTALSDEAWRRITEHGNWEWQTRSFIGRSIRATTKGLESMVNLPRRWIVNEPIIALVSAPYNNQFWDFPVALDDAKWRALPNYPAHKGEVGRFTSPGARDVEVPIVLLMGQTVVYRELVRARVDVLNSRDELLRPLDPSPTTDQAVRAMLEARIELSPYGQTILTAAAGRDPHSDLSRTLHIGCAIEVRRGSVVIGKARHVLSREMNPVSPRTVLDVDWTVQELPGAPRDPAGLSLFVRGDPAVAWDSFYPFQYVETSPTYWAGSFEVPPRTEPSAKP